MITGIEHTGISAENPEELARWYVEKLGMRLVGDNKKGTLFLAAPNAAMIEIYPARQKGQSGFDNYTAGHRHLAFSVDDFDRTWEDLKASGVKMAGEPVVNEAIKLVLFYDGEGNLCHLIARALPLGK